MLKIYRVVAYTSRDHSVRVVFVAFSRNGSEQDPNEDTAARAQRALQNGPLRAMCIPRPALETRRMYDGADEAVDFFEAEDDVVLIGEIAIILLALSVSYAGGYQQGAH
jgi:hypothetical protein